MNRHLTVAAVSLAVFSAGLTICAGAQLPAHAGHGSETVEFRISCSGRAQMAFNQAVTLLHHMTYPQAREAFEQIIAAEPQCAMAYWGVAMTLFQPLWPTRPGPADLQRGLESTRKARALSPRTDRERLFIAAAAAFFDATAAPNYGERLERWEKAQEKVYRAFPQDPESDAFYALALLATAPGDHVDLDHANRAAALLVKVYALKPGHPGAMHYLIHANDVPGREHELLEIVSRYETIAPENPHALHMPTHIFTRLGQWPDVIRGNIRAADAALKFRSGDHGQFVWDEYPHAIEYLTYAYLQQGADDEAAEVVKRLQSTAALEPTFKTAFHLASTRARLALERRQWREARELVPREPSSLDWDNFPWAEAVTWFARGLGAAHEKDLDAAREALARLRTLEARAEKSGEVLFTRNIRVLALDTSAWLAEAQGQRDVSIDQMRKAAELEAATPKHPVTPAPTIPAYELLGDLLIAQGEPAEALSAYERSLALYPGRFNSVLGAAQAARASANDAKARAFYAELLELGKSGMREDALKEARGFLRSQ